LLYVLAVLILLGGFGFFVIVGIYDHYKEKRLHLSTHTKVVLYMSAVITLLCFILFSAALRGHEIFYLINNSFFQTVSAITAGFYSVPMNLFSEFVEATLILLC
jgi:trk system potassium uptake protein TrkH